MYYKPTTGKELYKVEFNFLLNPFLYQQEHDIKKIPIEGLESRSIVDTV